MRIGNILKNKTSKSKLTISRLRKKVEKLEQEKTDLYKIIVDFKSYEKRLARHEIEFKKFANQELLQDILTIVDSIKEIPTYSNDGIAIDGVIMILKEVDKIFRKFNIELIDAVGKQFNPEFHQAMLLEETNECPDNTILSELQTGYMIHDRLLRPSMVVVSILKKGVIG
jgi:molecular chaperone GrpE